MSKVVAEGLHKLSISDLKGHGYLRGRPGFITWGRGSSSEASAHLAVSLGDMPRLRTSYTYTSLVDGDKKDLDYQIELTTTPCRYGGERFWFLCPNAYCKRRVGVLYQCGEYFMCRHCCNLAYQSQRLGGRDKGMVTFLMLDELRAKIKRTIYRGRPTKKYLRWERMSDRCFAQMGMPLR